MNGIGGRSRVEPARPRSDFHTMPQAVRALIAGSVAFLAGCAPRLAAPEADALLNGLFAPPTAAEIAVVEAEWAARDTEVYEPRVESRHTGRGGRRTLVISHTVDGVRHFGAVRIPAGADTVRLPVLVIAHGGDRGATGYQFFHQGPIAEGWIQVVPSFRSERLILSPLRWYRSKGSPSPWDRDVDDAMALLGTVLAQVPQADSSRVAVLGRSRGAGVALLMGIRDRRVDAVVDFFGPTDFFIPPVRALAARAIRSRIPKLPGAGYLADSVLFALRDGRISLERARIELLRRSPAWFADQLPPTQIHHGSEDGEVPMLHSERLADALRELGTHAAEWEYHRYPGGKHAPKTLRGSEQRAADFLNRFVDPPPGAVSVEMHLNPSAAAIAR